MTTTKMWLRLASVSSLLFSAGHTLGGRRSWSLGESDVFTAMGTVRFDTAGVSRTYLDFYRGFGFTLSVFLLLHRDHERKPGPPNDRDFSARVCCERILDVEVSLSLAGVLLGGHHCVSHRCPHSWVETAVWRMKGLRRAKLVCTVSIWLSPNVVSMNGLKQAGDSRYAVAKAHRHPGLRLRAFRDAHRPCRFLGQDGVRHDRRDPGTAGRLEVGSSLRTKSDPRRINPSFPTGSASALKRLNHCAWLFVIWRHRSANTISPTNSQSIGSICS
jgi:hypothetical protein